jgi:hypothetical protein
MEECFFEGGVENPALTIALCRTISDPAYPRAGQEAGFTSRHVSARFGFNAPRRRGQVASGDAPV